jgi:hypothetical protein
MPSTTERHLALGVVALRELGDAQQVHVETGKGDELPEVAHFG